jgi:hypothetical protein
MTGMHALVAEAMKKAAIAWVATSGDQEPHPVWCLWIDDALYVVSGPGEQPAPGLADASQAAVTARGDHGGRIVTWRAAVERVPPDGEAWQAVVPQLAAKRLNAEAAEAMAQRWARECVVSRLVPTDDAAVVSGTRLPDGSLAVPPPPSPAVRPAPRPFRLHRVRQPPSPR